jgi:hypothetical protein
MHWLDFKPIQKNTKKHFGRFGMLQVFQIVDSERSSDGSVLPTLKAGSKLRNLIQWYRVRTREDVTARSEWRNLITVKEWYSKNMGLSYELRVSQNPYVSRPFYDSH